MSSIKNFQTILNKNKKYIIEYANSKNISYEFNSKLSILQGIMEDMSKNMPDVHYEGVVEMINNYGFLRNKIYNFLNTPIDIYIPNYLIKKHNIQRGDHIKCTIKEKGDQKCFSAKNIISINDNQKTNKYRDFNDLTATYPEEQLILEYESEEKQYTNRIIDMISPIGLGQRGLIVAQPKAGKTTVLHHIAQGIIKNRPDVRLIIMLVGERPEEVDEMKNIIGNNPKVDIYSSTFDIDGEKQIKTSEMVLKYSKRRVELGENVVILMDSLTRLVRAYNHTVPSSGRVWSGGMEPEAIQRAKKFFGAARNIKEGGSLTILSTCLNQTGSKMDDVIYEELKGTGNMEIFLKREIANQQIFPAICTLESGTRRFERMVEKSFKIKELYNYLIYSSSSDPVLAMKKMLHLMNAYPTNDKLLDHIRSLIIAMSKKNFKK